MFCEDETDPFLRHPMQKKTRIPTRDPTEVRVACLTLQQFGSKVVYGGRGHTQQRRRAHETLDQESCEGKRYVPNHVAIQLGGRVQRQGPHATKA